MSEPDPFRMSMAKNLLIEQEILLLEHIVPMYLDYAENHAARQIPMKMANWAERLDAFVKFNQYEVLTDAGEVSTEVAKHLAEKQHEKCRIMRDRSFESDFESKRSRLHLGANQGGNDAWRRST
jgi:hypothetical protein